MSFRYDLQNLRPDQIHTVMSRERDAEIRNAGRKANAIIPDTSPGLHIFMRLGLDTRTGLDGRETISAYLKHISNHGQGVWFSTNALTKGMAKDKVNYFLNEIRNGGTVHFYFVISKTGGGSNEIEYRARVVDLVSLDEEIRCPLNGSAPEPWRELRSRIWVKIAELGECTDLTTRDFLVDSSRKILADAIHNSEYHFGYVRLKP